MICVREATEAQILVHDQQRLRGDLEPQQPPGLVGPDDGVHGAPGF